MQDSSSQETQTPEELLSSENADNQGFGENDDSKTEAELVLEGASEAGETEEKENSKKMDIFISPPLKIRNFDDVKLAVEDHAAWIESVVNPRKDIKAGRANFKGSDLSGYNLAGVDLRGATFTNSICRGTIFTGANLSGAHFNRADLSGADFRGAKLKRAQFEHAILVGADWDDAQLEHANFRYAKRDSVSEWGGDNTDTELETQDISEEANASASASEEDLIDSTAPEVLMDNEPGELPQE